MKAVGIRELKARLSEYIRLVKTGETILVTDREEVVAELRPAHRRSAPPQHLDDVLMILAERGDVTRPSLAKGNWGWRVEGLGLPAGTAERLLDELRGERRTG